MNITYTGKFYKGLTREMKSPNHAVKLTYEVGQTYSVDDFDTSDKECSTGIHVVTSLAKALKWGPVVVEMTVPDSAQVVWGADKVRVSEATVVGLVNPYWAYLSGAYLSGADLYGANLSRANLSRANLSRANLSRANLSRANLSRANLYGADLSGADLYGADLSGADLYGADLSRADLSGAYLSRADLSGAYGTPASGAPNGWKLKDGFWTRDEWGDDE